MAKDAYDWLPAVMSDTKLALIEGSPGTGKSTTTRHIGSALQQLGIACRWYLEEDDPHPIACLDFAIKELPDKMIPLWTSFAEHAMQESVVTIIESRLWQNTALFMFMSNIEVEEIVQFNEQMGQALASLSPILVYLDQEDTEAALRRLYALRGEKWMQEALEMTTAYPWFQSRGLKDFAGWVQFFAEWQRVITQLFNDWPHRKIKVQNPHDDWERAYQQIDDYLTSVFLHDPSSTSGQKLVV
jgi:thymidylate kinase